MKKCINYFYSPSVCMYACGCVHMCMCVRVWACMCVYVHVFVCVSVRACVCTYVSVCHWMTCPAGLRDEVPWSGIASLSLSPCSAQEHSYPKCIWVKFIMNLTNKPVFHFPVQYKQNNGEKNDIFRGSFFAISIWKQHYTSLHTRDWVWQSRINLECLLHATIS